MSSIFDSARSSRTRLRLEFAALAVLLTVGAALRFYRLDHYPVGVQADELSNMYDGYSIAKTGADRAGAHNPVIVRGFGENDYRPAMYAWLASVPIELMGFSIKAGRLPAAILGVASLVFLYAFARSAGGGAFALIALLIGVLSPLHIQFSRVAREGAILPAFFFSLILYLWYRGSRLRFPLVGTGVLGLVVGLSVNAYHATKLTAFLFFLCIAADIARRLGKRAVPALLVFAITSALGALPQISAVAGQQQHLFARAKVLSVQADNPFSYAASVLWNYWLNLEPRYLFIPSEYDWTFGRLLLPEMLFFYAGLIGLVFLRFRRDPEPRWYIYLALLISILPAALAVSNPNPIRASGMAAVAPLVSAAGVVWIAERFLSRATTRTAYYSVAVAAIFISAAAVGWRYSQGVHPHAAYRENVLRKVDTTTGRLQHDYDAVLIENNSLERHLYVAIFAGMTPRQYQSAPKEIYSNGVDRFRRLGKYYFVWPAAVDKTGDALSTSGARILFVASRPLQGWRVVDSVAWENQKAYFMTH